MTSKDEDGNPPGEQNRLFQPKRQQRRNGNKTTLPKWLEDGRNTHALQEMQVSEIYEMRGKLIQNDERSLDHSLITRTDLQKYPKNQPLQGRPRAFTSPSLLDDVKGILISRRPGIKAQKNESAITQADGLTKAPGIQGKRLYNDPTMFHDESIDISDMNPVGRDMTRAVTGAVKDDDVFIKLTKCKRGRRSCHCVVPRQNGSDDDEPPVFDGAYEERERKEFCASKSDGKPVSKQRRESKKPSTDPRKEISTKEQHFEKIKSKPDSSSRLPKLKNAPRRKRYETELAMSGKQAFIPEQTKSATDDLSSKLDMFDAKVRNRNSPTSISPRSPSPYSSSEASISPTSPKEFHFPDLESSFPKVSIKLPPVPSSTAHVDSPRISLSNSSELAGDKAPRIVFRPATPYVERIENPVKPQRQGWSLWNAAKQTEMRRAELKALIDDIKEYNSSTKSIEQRLSHVST